MSHHSGFAFHAVDPQASDLDRVLPSPAIAALVRQQAARPVAGAKPRLVHGITRSDWIKVAARALLDAAGDFEALRFFSEEHETRREFVPGGDGSGHGQDLRVTLFDPRTQLAVAAEIDRLLAWCAVNVTEVVRALDFDGEIDVLQAIHHTPAQDRPTELGDEGQGSDCLFSLLKAVRQGLRRAQADGLCALYINDQFTTQDWYRHHLSRPGVGEDGALHETRTLAQPPAPPRAMPVPAPAGIPVDPERLRSMPRVVPPGWVEGDALKRLFDAQEALLRDGHVVWAAFIQVNQYLLHFRDAGVFPGEVVYDPAGRLSPDGLVKVASALYDYKGREDLDPERRAFGAYLAVETERAFGRTAPVYCGYPLLVSTTCFASSALPDGWLAAMTFPLVVSPAHPGLVLPLHHSLWPDEVLARWKLAASQRPAPPAPAPAPAEPVDPGLAALDVAKQYLADVHNQDLVAASLWLRKAAAHGNAEAVQLLREYELADAPRADGGWLSRIFKPRG